MSKEEVRKAALELSEEERVGLGYELISSAEPEVDPAVQDAWRDVVEKRLADVDAGRVEAVSGEEVGRRLDALRAKRRR